MAVHRHGRERNDHLGDTVTAGRLQHGECGVERRPLRDRVRVVTGQQREVVDDVGSPQADRGLRIGRGHVEMMEPERAARCPSRCEVGERADAEIVDHVDGVILGEQTVDEVGADESRSTDDDHVHRVDRSVDRGVTR